MAWKFVSQVPFSSWTIIFYLNSPYIMSASISKSTSPKLNSLFLIPFSWKIISALLIFLRLLAYIYLLERKSILWLLLYVLRVSFNLSLAIYLRNSQDPKSWFSCNFYLAPILLLSCLAQYNSSWLLLIFPELSNPSSTLKPLSD